MEEQSKNMKTVFTVVERGPGKSFWVRIGAGFENTDHDMLHRAEKGAVEAFL